MTTTTTKETDEDQEISYLVSLQLNVKAEDPAIAARMLVAHVLEHGFGSMLFNVIDNDEEEEFIATLNSFSLAEDYFALADSDPDEDESEGRPETTSPLLREKGICKRCGDLAEVGPSTKLCQQCEEDVQGVGE